MDLILKKAENFSYSDSDIKRFLDNDVVIRKYSELANCRSLDDIITDEKGEKKSCSIILYMIKPNFGHWTALIKDPGLEKGTFEFFDSYGLMPDDELKYVPKGSESLNGGITIDEKGDERPNELLGNLILNDMKYGKVKNVYYNKTKLQEDKTSSIDDESMNMNTCGRWCSVRCQLRNFKIDEFCLIFLNQKLKGDDYVTLLTLMNK